jgi:hypothetical protein
MRTMMLFDEFVRTYNGKANHMEDDFSFLNRSARSAYERVRAVLEDWYESYPDHHKGELKRRLRSDFSAGFFELLLHQLLLRLNYDVEVHPAMASTRRTRPDFQIKDSAGTVVFVEAVIVTDESREEKARNKVFSVLYDQINHLEIPDYFLDIDTIHNPKGKQPSGRRLRRFISTCIKSLNYEALSMLLQVGAIEDLPRWTYKEGELEIDFGVIPVSGENRGKLDHKPIGIYPGGFRWGGSDSAIRSKIIKKAQKYGHLGTSYLIGVNCLSKWGTSKSEEIRALFGTERVSLKHFCSQVDPDQKPDGVWLGPKGPRKRGLTGVLLTTVYPWNLPKANLTLFHNPWADYPYKGPLCRLPQAIVTEDGIKMIEGDMFGSVLSLPRNWPGELFKD